MKMTLSDELQWRGFVNQTTLGDLQELDKRKFKLYFGVDPSADSMTVGNLAAAMMVRCFMKHGHGVTLLVGGATGMIGDPSGKDSERSLLSLEQVVQNKQSIANQYKTIFADQPFRLVDNYDWFKKINYLDFLREVGKHFSMTPLLQREFVANRIGPEGSGLSYAEFSYTLIQGYDYYYLHQTYGIDLQVCGSDQWGNSLSGVELIRRKTGHEVHVYSVPLIINKSSGKKFGKSEDGAVWLDEDKTSAYRFYQFWLNIDDESSADYLKIFTEIDKDSFDELMRKFKENPKQRLAQKTLAYEVTKLVHGSKKADIVRSVSEILFESSDYKSLSTDSFKVLEAELPVVHASLETSLITVLQQSGLASSQTEARRFLGQGAVYVNGKQVNPDHVFSSEDVLQKRFIVLRRGKNAHAILDLRS